ncbi:MAG: hypothetical protein AW09_004388 [Candidatus Accumulibacter phosphatis]|uniref:Uncharacterized protein n=1 Tax=Candidatus Accumulibacter phosphatis TaxID=327160 RepID=A0A084Y721_9PROT|nr:MAG: hypothetical protein AW09_004388 [Candidatus Accumulibacter phosphatis]
MVERLQLGIERLQAAQLPQLPGQALAAATVGNRCEATDIAAGLLLLQPPQHLLEVERTLGKFRPRLEAGPDAVGSIADRQRRHLRAPRSDPRQRRQVAGDVRLTGTGQYGLQSRANPASGQPGHRPHGLFGLCPVALQLQHVQLLDQGVILDRQLPTQALDFGEELQSLLQILDHRCRPGLADLVEQRTALLQQGQAAPTGADDGLWPGRQVFAAAFAVSGGQLPIGRQGFGEGCGVGAQDEWPIVAAGLRQDSREDAEGAAPATVERCAR